MKDLVIIGGGASGLTAAITAARNGKNVTIIEKNNKCAKKLLITGNGKCNFWNEDQNLIHYHSNNKELLNKFITKERQNLALKFINSLGIVPKIKNGYYYPFSNQALSMHNALLLECQKLNIQIIKDLNVTNIIKKETFIINPNKENIKTKNIIISTGSKAAPKTGSDGQGYELAKKFNHNIITPLPSLVQLKGKEPYFKNWSGLRCEVTVSLFIDNKFIKKETGEIQLTDYGVSGICIFNLSRYASIAINKNKKVKISINFMPFTEKPKEFIKNLNKNTYKKTTNELLEGFLNYKLIDIILKKAKIKRNIPLNTLTENEINKLIQNITNFELNITETHNMDHAQVCTGGIPLTEINSETLESLKIKNLYFTGEIIDIDGDCGGYNLSWAWISGIIAGKSVK